MNKIKEGDLYKRIELCGVSLEIRYGYYDDIDRKFEAIPIFPDFIKYPVYTSDGKMLVTYMQDKCDKYDGDIKNISCYDCKFFKKGIDLIGICQNPLNQKEVKHEED